MKKLFLILAILLINLPLLNAQAPPCFNVYQGLTFPIQKITNFPPLNTGMPYDVLIGYIVIDSVCVNADLDTVNNFLAKQIYDNDTIKYLKKFWYVMTDYDPFIFNQVMFYTGNKTYKTHPSILYKSCFDFLSSNCSKGDLAIITSSIIAHIKVSDLKFVFDSNAVLNKEGYIVTGEILDTMKGRVFPSCKDFYHNDLETESVFLDHELPENCLQFEYCRGWTRGDNKDNSIFIEGREGKKLIDDNGQPYIKGGMEYIIFLKPVIACDEQNIFHYTIFPNGLYSEMYNLFPVVDGVVIDPEDEFNFGTGLSVEEFKTSLRNRINSIINFLTQ